MFLALFSTFFLSIQRNEILSRNNVTKNKVKMQSTTKAREELEGTVWAWVDKIQDPDRDPISKEDLFHAYKLFFPTHQSPKWKCKKNCRQNPNCFCGKIGKKL